jgi:hypothetical protein
MRSLGSLREDDLKNEPGTAANGAAALKDIISRPREPGGQDLGDFARPWLQGYCPDPNEPAAANPAGVSKWHADGQARWGD